MPTSGLSLKSILNRAGGRLFHGQRPPQEGPQNLDTLVESLLETVFAATRDLRRRTAAKVGKEESLVTQPWSLEIELSWFLLASIMRNVSMIPEMGPDDRDSLHAALLEAFISQVLGSKNLAPAYSDQRGRLVGRLQRWYGQALGEYQGISRMLPSADALSMGDSMCGRAAQRMATALGKKDNLAMELTLASWMVEVWIAIDPGKVAGLCAQVHLNSRGLEQA